MLQTELAWIVVPFMKLGNIKRGLDMAKKHKNSIFIMLNSILLF